MEYINDDEYIFTYYDMGNRLGNCRLSLVEIDNLPILLITSTNSGNLFSSMINMISGRYYRGDKLTDEECIRINEFMNQSPNFHDGIHCEEGDCNNWTFMIIQYIAEITPRTYNITYILSNVRKYGDEIIAPRFDLCNTGFIITTVDQLIEKFNCIIGEK